MKVVIIGTGAAGLTAAETLRKYDRTMDITIITKDKNMPYSPVALHKYIEGEILKEKLFLWNAEFVHQSNFELILRKAVMDIHFQEKQIILDDQSRVRYDKLIIAWGASPKINANLKNRDGVFSIRSLRDAEIIRNHFKNRAVIYGAGAVATKIAVALKKKGN